MRFHGTITVSNTDHDDFTRNRTKVVASYRCPVAGCGSSFESIQVGPDEEMADMIDGLDRRAAKYAADHRDHHDTDKGPYAGPWKTHAEAAAPGRPMGDTKAQTGGEWRTPQGIPTPEDAALFDRGTEYGTKPVEVSFLVHATPDEMALLPTPRRNGKRGKRGPVGPQGPQGAKGDPGLPPAPDEVYNAVARWFEEHPHRIYTNPELMGFFVTPEAQASNTDVTPESVAEAANPQVTDKTPARTVADTLLALQAYEHSRGGPAAVVYLVRDFGEPAAGVEERLEALERASNVVYDNVTERWELTPVGRARAKSLRAQRDDDGYTPPATDAARRPQLAALVEALQAESSTGWVTHAALADLWVGSRSALNKTLHAMLKDGSIEADYGTEDNRYRLHVA